MTVRSVCEELFAEEGVPEAIRIRRAEALSVCLFTILLLFLLLLLLSLSLSFL